MDQFPFFMDWPGKDISFGDLGPQDAEAASTSGSLRGRGRGRGGRGRGSGEVQRGGWNFGLSSGPPKNDQFAVFDLVLSFFFFFFFAFQLRTWEFCW